MQTYVWQLLVPEYSDIHYLHIFMSLNLKIKKQVKKPMQKQVAS